MEPVHGGYCPHVLQVVRPLTCLFLKRMFDFMKRRIFTAFLAVVLIFTMAIPALAASSYTYEGTYDNVPYQFTASCTTSSAQANTCYGSTNRTVSTTVTVKYTSGATLTYSTEEKTLEAKVVVEAGSKTIDQAVCTFRITGAVTRSTTISPDSPTGKRSSQG